MTTADVCTTRLLPHDSYHWKSTFHDLQIQMLNGLLMLHVLPHERNGRHVSEGTMHHQDTISLYGSSLYRFHAYHMYCICLICSSSYSYPSHLHREEGR